MFATERKKIKSRALKQQLD